jgi:type IV pilus assembly protein PilY1
VRALAVALLLSLPASAWAQGACYNLLTRTTYGGGFSSGDVSSSYDASVSGGTILLDTSLTTVDSNHVTFPFDQDVRVKYLGYGTGTTTTQLLGWMFLDQLIPTYYDPATDTLPDNDGDGEPDFHRALYDRIAGTNVLLTLANNYSDGGNYPHIPNMIEPAPIGKGNLIFLLMNDNVSTGWTNVYNGVDVTPIQDASNVTDNIPDYDVNGDGAINTKDRVVDLGSISGNREIVFFMMAYRPMTGERRAYGYYTSPTSTVDSGLTALFSKASLNGDFGALPNGATIRYTDLGAPSYRAISQCEKATPAGSPSGVPTPIVGNYVACGSTTYPSWTNANATLQNKVYGFIETSWISLLNTQPYNYIALPHEVVRVTASSVGSMPHMFLGAPTTDPNRWVVGMENLLGYTASSCPTCTQGDFSLDDAAFVVQHAAGGSAQSQAISTEIVPADLTQSDISKVHVSWSADFPAPCTQPPDSRIDLYVSVDNGTSWHQVRFPTDSPWEATVDLLSLGVVGNQLRWKANFVTPVKNCQPVLNTLNVGYEAMPGGEYTNSSPIAAGNVLFRADSELLSTGWTITGNDTSPRGRLRMVQLNDADTHADTNITLWDAGTQLSTRNPDSRTIYYNSGGTRATFSTAAASSLFSSVLTTDDRTQRVNGTLVYDLNSDQVADDNDAKTIVQWVRGWESSGVQRAWKLGGLDHGTPAFAGPPSPQPWWLSGSATPASDKATYTTFATTNANRNAVTISGGDDGLVHAFASGSYRYGDDPATPSVETRGYFLLSAGTRDYGDGSELWAFVPSGQLDQLKNNLPAVASYLPDLNPRASVDGSVTIDDIAASGVFHTVAVVVEGAVHPYITAVDITDPSSPQPMWVQDWTDTDYNGTQYGPAMGPTLTGTGRQYVTAVTSGLATLAENEFVYLIDSASGTTISKIQLNAGSVTDPAYGMVGPPAMVDSEGDGVIDRLYVVDTSGRLFKVNTASSTVCEIGTTGETVYSPLALTVDQGDPAKVRIFIGGGDNPYTNDTVGTYHLTAFEDDDQVGACNKATVLYAQALPAGQKVWAAPVVSGDDVFIGTSTGDRLDVCGADPMNPGQILGYASDPNNNGQAIALFPPTSVGAGGSVGGLLAFDGHLFVNALNSTTTLLGAPKWNNVQGGSVSSGINLPTTDWSEP